MFQYLIHQVILYLMNSFQKYNVIILSNISNIYYRIYHFIAFSLTIFMHLQNISIGEYSIYF